MAIPVTFTTGTLPPPACYATEQARFKAYIAALTGTVPDGYAQWIRSATTPAAGDRDKIWLRLDVNGYPQEALVWVVAASAWVRWFTVPHIPITSGGGANAYAITFNPPVTALNVGDSFWFIANAANTAAATLQIDALAAAAITTAVNQALAAGAIKAGQAVQVTWDGTEFQMTSAAGSVVVAATNITPGTAGQALRTRSIGAGPTLTTIWESSLYGTTVANQQSFPADGASVIFSHNLTIDGTSVAPVGYGADGICTDAGGDAGYNLNDKVAWGSFYRFDGGGAGVIPMTLWSNTAAIGVVRAAAPVGSTSVYAPPKSGAGAGIVINEAKWKVIAWGQI